MDRVELEGGKYEDEKEKKVRLALFIVGIVFDIQGDVPGEAVCVALAVSALLFVPVPGQDLPWRYRAGGCRASVPLRVHVADHAVVPPCSTQPLSPSALRALANTDT